MRKTLLTFLAAALLLADDVAVLRDRVKGRAEAIKKLVAGGIASETKGGLLRAEGGASAEDKKLIKLENDDRRAAWDLVATRTRTPVEDVKARFAERAWAGQPKTPPAVACGRPGSPDQLTRLVNYMYQGLRLSDKKDYEAALKEFQAMVGIDATFLGANLNVGTALLRLGRYEEAAKSYQAEVALTDCLAKLPEDKLGPFCYMLEVNSGSPQPKQMTGECQSRVKEARQYAWVSLAGLHSIQKKKDAALEALKAARDAGYTSWAKLERDPDLAYVRTQPEYKEVAR